jgi:hypothetical protein
MNLLAKCTGCSTRRSSPTNTRINEATYNTQLKSIINGFHANRKMKKDDLETLFNSIRTLVGGTRTNFFIKSFYSQALFVDTFSGFPVLEGNSANCKFQIADVTLNGKSLKFFYKIVKYESQDRSVVTNKDDLLLYDVVNSLIIERIIHKNNGNIQYSSDTSKSFKLRDHIPVYVDSTLSFYKKDSQNSYWDYNIIKYTNPISPHNYKTVINSSPTIYKDKSMILAYIAINMISFEKVFINYRQYSRNELYVTIARRALFGYIPLINVLLYLGIIYGFMHNDLHSGNIVYNLDTNNLMIIDFGRTSFKKYIDTSMENINNCVHYNAHKLGYDDIYRSLSLNNYSGIYSHTPLFNHTLSISLPHDPSFYFGFIFDVITLTLQVYIKTILFFNIEESAMMTRLNPYLKNIIFIDYNNVRDNLIDDFNFSISTSLTIDELFNNYRICKREISHIRDAEIISLFNELTDNLLITALFLHSRQLQRQTIRIDSKSPRLAKPFHWALQIVDKSCKLEDFYNYIDTLFQIDTYHDDLNNISYINSIFKYRGTSMRGGKMQMSKSKIDDNDYSMSDIFEKYGKTSKRSSSSSISKNDNLINNYIDVYDYKEKYSYPEQNSDNEEDLLSRTSTVRSTSLHNEEDMLSKTSTVRSSSSRRTLKNYKEI